MITLGVCSPLHGTGVTHLCVSLAVSLTKAHNKVFVKGDFEAFSDELEEPCSEYETFEHNGITFCYGDTPSLAWLSKNGYDFLITDYGTKVSEDCLRSDYPLAVLPSREWSRSREEVYRFFDFLTEKSRLEQFIFFIPFADRTSRKEMKAYAKEELDGATFLFTRFEDNPFKKCMDSSFVREGHRRKTRHEIKALQKASLKLERETERQRENITRLDLENAELSQAVQSGNAEIERITRESEQLLEQERVKANEEMYDIRVRYEAEMKESEQKADERYAQYEAQLQSVEIAKAEIEKEKARITEEKEQAEIVSSQRIKTLLHDELTGCYNRKAYSEHTLPAEYTVIAFDVNNLKQTNDTLGHVAGDKLLVRVAKVLLSHFDKVYRMGGDEFNVITESRSFDKTVLDTIDAELKAHGDTIAYGYANSSEAQLFPDIEKLADKRMYENKRAKKGMDIAPIEAEVIESAETYAEMWHLTEKVAFERNGAYDEITFHVFPAVYENEPMACSSVVVIEHNSEYSVAYGKNNIFVADRLKDITCYTFSPSLTFPSDQPDVLAFTVTLRFQNGYPRLGIIPNGCTIMERTAKVKSGVPAKEWGIPYSAGRLYPVRTNIDGLCDTVHVTSESNKILFGYGYDREMFTLHDDTFTIESV